MDNKLKDYDMEICGVCRGSGVCYAVPEWGGDNTVNYPCPECGHTLRPGYIIIPKPEFRPDEINE